MALTVAELKAELEKLGSVYDNRYPVVYHESGREFSVTDIEVDAEHNDVLISIEENQ
jgi:hypothetical protein